MAVRTIIFRGKRIDNGEWVEGSYCHAEKLDRSGDEHFIIEYSANGRSEAARKTNTEPIHIYECCKGIRKTAGGFRWMEMPLPAAPKEEKR